MFRRADLPFRGDGRAPAASPEAPTRAVGPCELAIGVARAAVFALLLALPAAGCKNAAPHADAPVPVVVRHVSGLDRAATVSASGALEARLSSDLAFQVSGRVAEVLAREGQHVAKGALLAALDETDYRLAFEQAKAAADRARDDYTRLKELHDKGSLAASDFVKAETANRQAAAQHDLAAKQLAECRLTAPFAGVVARRGLDPGEQVGAGMPVFTLMDLHPIEAKVGVPERDVEGVRVGQTAEVQVPALPGRTFTGRVSLVGVAADPAARTYTVKIVLPNPGGVLRHGMVAESHIRLDQKVAAVTLPGDAIVNDPNGATLVYVYFPAEKRVYSRRVTVGDVHGREVEIRDGLAGDEWVVIAGQNRVRDGSLVATAGPPAPADSAAGSAAGHP